VTERELSVTERALAESAAADLRQAGLVIVADHGRAGNMFVKRTFDLHPEVLCVTMVGYLYRAILSVFGAHARLTGGAAYDGLMAGTNVNLVAEDLSPAVEQSLRRTGDDPSAAIDRPLVRAVLRHLLTRHETTTPVETLVAVHAAFAVGTGRPTAPIRYMLVDDTVSSDADLAAIEAATRDVPNCRVVHLVRDPRAGFASIRHTYVELYGSMYPLRLPAAWEACGSNGIWLWALASTTAGARALTACRHRLGPTHARVLRNEDVNLDFPATMRALAEWLGVGHMSAWDAPDYAPTSCGRLWQGISAYSRQYVPTANGPLKADPDATALHPGPSRMNVERWKKRLPPHEVAFVEAVYFDEMREHGYVPLHVTTDSDRQRGLRQVWKPFVGEVPGLRWLAAIRPNRWAKDSIIRAAYYPLLPIAGLWARVQFFRLLSSGRLRTQAVVSPKVVR